MRSTVSRHSKGRESAALRRLPVVGITSGSRSGGWRRMLTQRSRTTPGVVCAAEHDRAHDRIPAFLPFDRKLDFSPTSRPGLICGSSMLLPEWGNLRMRCVSNGELPQHGWVPRGGLEGRPAGARAMWRLRLCRPLASTFKLTNLMCHFPGPGSNLAGVWLLIMMAPDIGRSRLASITLPTA